MAVARDGSVVLTESVSGVLRRFVDDWNRRRPPTGGKFAGKRSTAVARTEIATVGAIEWLADASGVADTKIEKILYAPHAHPHTELRVVDALVAALERPELFHDGTLEVLVNPRAKRDVQAECRATDEMVAEFRTLTGA